MHWAFGPIRSKDNVWVFQIETDEGIDNTWNNDENESNDQGAAVGEDNDSQMKHKRCLPFVRMINIKDQAK